MGYSNPENKPWAQQKIIELKPTTVLDVGAGQGTYLNLIRDGLGAGVIVNAVEVWQPYIDEFNLLNRYDKLFPIDVRDMTNFGYDLVILGDVLEHMSESDALILWERISKQAKYAMISIPIVHYHQDAINGNPYEVHVEEDWTVEKVLEKFSHIVEHNKFEVTGTFIAEFNNDNS
jgi:hypothetical protein